jgi:hypothetical protein
MRLVIDMGQQHAFPLNSGAASCDVRITRERFGPRLDGRVVSSADDRTVRLWDLTTVAQTARLDATPPLSGRWRCWPTNASPEIGVAPIAERFASGDYDRLHHFVAAGVWDAAPLEAELLVQADKLAGGSDAVLVIDDTALP